MNIRKTAPLFAAAATLLLSPVMHAAEPAAAGASDLHPPAPFIRKGSLNQNPALGKLKGRLLRIKRPLLMVHDLERSIHFYVDLIGLDLYDVEPTYNRSPASLGYEMFNIKPGSRKRMATLNTSNEIRGLTLEELRDMDWKEQQEPRTHTILFETDDAIAIIERVRAAGYSVIEPKSGEIPASIGVPALRFVEGGVVDPDGHVVSFFQYFNDDEEWKSVSARYSSARK